MLAKRLESNFQKTNRFLAAPWPVLAVSFAAACLLPVAAFGHGAIDERIAELTADLKLAPEDPMIHFMLADAHAQHEDWVAAMRSLARTEELAPGKFPTGIVRAQINLGAGRAEEARAGLDAFLAKEPKNGKALLLRARAFAALKDQEQSISDYRSALAVTKQPELDLVEEAADALAAWGLKEEAVQVLAGGIEKLGPVPSLALKAMDLEIATGRFDDALTRVEAVQKNAPRPEPWMARRAALLEKAGRKEEAAAAWRTLDARLATLPALERGSPAMAGLAAEAQRARGKGSRPAPVVAPPAPAQNSPR